MSKLFTRATVSGATLAGSGQKSVNTGLWDALNTAGLTDSTRTTVTTTSTLLTTQCGLLLVDCTSGSITLTLPTSGATTDDAVYNIRRIDNTANTLSVQRGGTDTVEGAATALSVAAGGVLGIQMPAGATNWRVFNQSNVASQDSRAQTQAATAFTSAGTAPTYTLTPSPAITALTANQRFRIKVHSANSGAASTLAVNGLTATGIKQYDALGNKVDPILAASQLVDVEYDGTHWVVIDPLPATLDKIQSITAVASSPSMGVTINPTTLDFRVNPITSGAVNTRSLSSSATVTIPGSATLGTASGVRSRIAVLAIDNSGAIEAAVVNTTGTFDFSETGLITTTTISSGATSANVAYSTTGRTNVPYRVVGFFESTQTTAGTWAANPSRIQGSGGLATVVSQALTYNGSQIPTTSGTSVDNFTIPAWAKRITIALNRVSTSGTSNMMIQLGAAGLVTTGYSGEASMATTAVFNSSGLSVTAAITATSQASGTITLIHVGSNIWVSSGVLANTDTNYMNISGGAITLTGQLDQIRLTTAAGTDTFDNGSITYLVE